MYQVGASNVHLPVYHVTTSLLALNVKMDSLSATTSVSTQQSIPVHQVVLNAMGVFAINVIFPSCFSLIQLMEWLSVFQTAPLAIISQLSTVKNVMLLAKHAITLQIIAQVVYLDS